MQKVVELNKTLRGRMNFKDRLLKKSIKIITKSIKKEGTPKAAQKPLQNSIFGAMLASQTLPKWSPNQMFEQFLRLFFLVVNLHRFFWQFCGRFCFFFVRVDL